MSEVEAPNWVAARGQCDLDGVFEILVGIVRRDVEAANQLPVRKRHGRTFAVTAEKDSAQALHHRRLEVRGTAAAESSLTSHAATFLKEATQLTIRTTFFPRPFTVTVAWDQSQSVCRTYFAVPHQTQPPALDLWEISKAVLEPLFFTAAPDLPGSL